MSQNSKISNESGLKFFLEIIQKTHKLTLSSGKVKSSTFDWGCLRLKKPPYSNGPHAGRIAPGVGFSPVHVLRRQKHHIRNRFIVNSG
jgi:hypothetical protein